MDINKHNVSFGSIVLTKSGYKYIDNMLKNGTKKSEINNVIREQSQIKRTTIYVTDGGPVVHDNKNGKIYTPTGSILNGKYDPIVPNSEKPVEYELAVSSSPQYTKEELERANKYNADFLLPVKETYKRKSENSYLSYLGNDMRAKLADDKMNAALDIANDIIRNDRTW